MQYVHVSSGCGMFMCAVDVICYVCSGCRMLMCAVDVLGCVTGSEWASAGMWKYVKRQVVEGGLLTE